MYLYVCMYVYLSGIRRRGTCIRGETGKGERGNENGNWKSWSGLEWVNRCDGMG